MKTTFILPIVGLALGVTALWGATNTYAQNPAQYQNLVTKIAQRFNLNENDVKQVFDDVHAQKMQHMQTQFEDKVSQLVTQGKITEAQKQAILAKYKELESQQQQNREQFKNMTPAERKTAKEKMSADLKSWAESQGITTENLFGFMHMKGMMGHKPF